VQNNPRDEKNQSNDGVMFSKIIERKPAPLHTRFCTTYYKSSFLFPSFSLFDVYSNHFSKNEASSDGNSGINTREHVCVLSLSVATIQQPCTWRQVGASPRCFCANQSFCDFPKSTISGVPFLCASMSQIDIIRCKKVKRHAEE
jgi:hypothetical protein